jgi:hypothetical protein
MQIMKLTYRLFPEFRGWLCGLPDSRLQTRCLYSMGQVTFCTLMMFLTRQRSLRAFCMENRDSEWALHNFQKWLPMQNVPTDDEVRYVLADVPTSAPNELLRKIHQGVERKKILADQKFMDTMELVSLDGSGQLSSYNLCFENALTRKTQTAEGLERTLFLHGQLVATLTNPSATFSLPLFYEPIERQGTAAEEYNKNDCEINAAKRLLAKLKTLYPKRSFCFLGDNLFAATTIAEIVKDKSWHFIFTAKPEKNRELFSWAEMLKEHWQTLEVIDGGGSRRIYRFQNKLPLAQFLKEENAVWVNLLEMTEIRPDGSQAYFNSWVTDLNINKENVIEIAQGGRARFASIENRVFNEQKNLGFQMEHNFGHFGNLPNVFFGFALVAQCLTQLFCVWGRARPWIKNAGSIRRYFEQLAVMVSQTVIDDDGIPILYCKFEFGDTS